MSGRQMIRRQAPVPLSQRDPVKLAEHFARSGYFRDAGDLSKAVVKIVAGEELGLGPMASMSGIHIIEGKPSLSANLLATQVKRHPAYDYIVREVSAEKARIEFLQNGESIGISEFTIAEARQAGLVKEKSGWAKYPRAMLFARALSQGVRWFCPDVTAGSPAYVPEELGAEVTEDGEVIVTPQAEPEPVVEAEVIEPEPTITKAAAARLYDAAAGVESIDPDMFAQAVSYVLGADCGDVTTKKAATEVLAQLTEPQAQKLAEWIDRKRPVEEVAEVEVVDGE